MFAVKRKLEMFVVLLVTVIIALVQAQDCRTRSLARFNVTFEGLWSKTVFPKQYPLFRPPAQWSAVLGRSHNSDYVLWREGLVASAGMKQFSELGKTEILDVESQGKNGILDVFKIPAIKSGVGTSHADFFVDSNHPKVSIASHIVPSPDWFVGLDSVMLCHGGRWAPEVSMELNPWDAGTDKGFTFTAPNWPEVPQLGISTITAHFPDHPANSFFYPDIEKLPPLARVTFKRVGTYDLTEGTDQTSDIQDNSGEVYNSYKNVADQPGDLSNSEPKQEPIVYEEIPTQKTVVPQTESVNEVHTQSTVRRRKRPGYKGRRTIVRRRKTGRIGKRPIKRKSPAGSGVRPKVASPVDCEVSQWTDWSPCSKTCGFGTKSRRRYIATKPENNGRPCPLLVEDELCGSMRTCGWKHFQYGSIFKPN